MAAIEHGYDFGDARFDLDSPRDREILRFILSQALYGEATGVYCGRSLYAARSLEAAKFYVRQARQELAHLELFADVFRLLDLEPEEPHWVVKLLATHNDHYPLKVLLEHALGEGMVLDVFRDVLVQTLPEADPRSDGIVKRLRAVCREEVEHVAWGEREVKRLLVEQPSLALPYYGLYLLQMALVPRAVETLRGPYRDHPVLSQLDRFVTHVQDRVRDQGRALGFVPDPEPGPVGKARAIATGLVLYARSQVAGSRSTLDKTYLRELGFRA